MTSILSTGTKRRNTPSWCHPGMFAAVPPFIAGRPTALNAVVKWSQITSGGEIQIVETLHLVRHKTVPAWYGSYQEGGWKIHVGIVDPMLGVKYYRIKVAVYHDGAQINSVSFNHVQPKDQLRWDTGNLICDFERPFQFMLVRIMG